MVAKNTPKSSKRIKIPKRIAIRTDDDDIPKEKRRPLRDEMKFLLSDKVDNALGRLKLDPIAEMVMYAKGDVVGLGLMTQEELDQDEEFNAEGMLVRRSGHSRALDLIPPVLRAKMASELLSYHHPRKKESPIEEVKDDEKVQFYLPESGREVKK